MYRISPRGVCDERSGTANRHYLPCQFHSTSDPPSFIHHKRCRNWKWTVSLNTPLNYCQWYVSLHNIDGVYCFFQTNKNITTTDVLRSALVWNYTLRRIVVSYRLYGTTCQFYLRSSFWIAWPLKMVSLGSPETSVWYCHSTLRKFQKSEWLLIYTST